MSGWSALRTRLRDGPKSAKAIFGFFAYASTACALATGTSANAQSPRIAATTIQAQQAPATAALPPASPAYPLKVSSNNRYLVDQIKIPFLMVGDAPQTLITNLSPADAKKYMANRQSYGINTLWVNLLCNYPDVPCCAGS
jgi:hypothetical protein